MCAMRGHAMPASSPEGNSIAPAPIASEVVLKDGFADLYITGGAGVEYSASDFEGCYACGCFPCGSALYFVMADGQKDSYNECGIFCLGVLPSTTAAQEMKHKDGPKRVY